MENKLFIETPFGDLIAYESITAFMRGNCGGEFTIEAYQGGKDRITLATFKSEADRDAAFRTMATEIKINVYKIHDEAKSKFHIDLK